MNTYADTLAEWYANAERITRDNLPNDGDTIIYPLPGGAYTIEPATFGWVASIVHSDDNVRILTRAPKPTPAWHDAVAVLANHRDYEDEPRTVWTRESDPEGHGWSDAHTTMAAPHHLVNVTPLIEAKVDDAMRDRVRDYYRTEHHVELPRDDVWLNNLLTAALGLDPA